MTILPIFARELRVTASRRHLHWLRLLAAALATGALAWLLIIDTTGAVSLTGRHLVRALANVALFFCLLAGAITTAGTIRHEHREGTLGLLFLTGLRGRDIVLGKLCVSALPMVGAVLGLLPLLAVSILVGGVRLSDVGLVGAVLANTLFVSLALGLLISAFSRNESRALTAAVIAPLALALGPYAAGQLWFGAEDKIPFTQLPDAVLLPSPCFGVSLIYDESSPVFRQTVFLQNLGFIHALGWILVALAGLRVGAISRSGEPRPWQQRLDDWVRRWIYGTPAERLRRRARLLDIDPILWLGLRHQRKAAYLWLLVGSLAVIAVWAGAQTRGIWFEWKPALGFLLIVHGAMKLCFVSEACHRLGEDRHRGSFELLLTTAATVPGIARGHGSALWRTFRGPLSALVALDLAWLWMDWHRPDPDHDRWVSAVILGSILTVFFADLLALKWMSLWQALATTSATRAVVSSVLRIMVLPWTIFLGIAVPARWIGPGTSSAKGREAVVLGLLALLWLAISLANAGAWRWRMRWMFLKHCRRIAAEGLVGWRAHRSTFFVDTIDSVRSRWRELFTVRFWRRHQILAAGAVGAMAAGVVLTGTHLRLQRQIQADLDLVRSKGVPVDARDLERWHPAAPADQNAVTHLRAAVEFMRVPQGVRPEPILLPGRAGRLTPRQRESYEALLRTNSSVIAATEQALAAKGAWFDPSSQFAITPGRFRGSLPLRLGSLLLVDATLKAEDGRINEACARLSQALQLAKLIGQQPRCMGQTVRHAMLHLVLDALERSLARAPLPPPQLERLAVELAEAERSESLQRALAGEQWIVIDTWNRRRSAISVSMAAAVGRPDFPERVLRWFGQSSGLAGREFRELLAALADVTRLPELSETNRVSLGRQLRDSSTNAGYFFPDSPQLLQNVGGTVVSHAICVARLRAALWAIQLEEQRRTRGEQAIDDAESGVTVPGERATDPFSGSLLRVRRFDRGYEVLSHGSHSEDVFWINRLTGREADEAIGFVVER